MKQNLSFISGLWGKKLLRFSLTMVMIIATLKSEKGFARPKSCYPNPDILQIVPASCQAVILFKDLSAFIRQFQRSSLGRLWSDKRLVSIFQNKEPADGYGTSKKWLKIFRLSKETVFCFNFKAGQTPQIFFVSRFAKGKKLTTKVIHRLSTGKLQTKKFHGEDIFITQNNRLAFSFPTPAQPSCEPLMVGGNIPTLVVKLVEQLKAPIFPGLGSKVEFITALDNLSHKGKMTAIITGMPALRTWLAHKSPLFYQFTMATGLHQIRSLTFSCQPDLKQVRFWLVMDLRISPPKNIPNKPFDLQVVPPQLPWQVASYSWLGVHPAKIYHFFGDFTYNLTPLALQTFFPDKIFWKNHHINLEKQLWQYLSPEVVVVELSQTKEPLYFFSGSWKKIAPFLQEIAAQHKWLELKNEKKDITGIFLGKNPRLDTALKPFLPQWVKATENYIVLSKEKKNLRLIPKLSKTLLANRKIGNKQLLTKPNLFFFHSNYKKKWLPKTKNSSAPPNEYEKVVSGNLLPVKNLVKLMKGVMVGGSLEGSKLIVETVIY